LLYEAFAAVVRRPVNMISPSVVLVDHDLGDICCYLVTIPPLLDPRAAAILDH
jgi:hypothetical protein